MFLAIWLVFGSMIGLVAVPTIIFSLPSRYQDLNVLHLSILLLSLIAFPLIYGFFSCIFAAVWILEFINKNVFRKIYSNGGGYEPTKLYKLLHTKPFNRKG